METRQIKGKQIAQMCQIEKKGLDKWQVPSQSGHGSYIVTRYAEQFLCNCPDFETIQQPCKHIYAVEIKVLKWFDNQGNETEVTIKKKYAQD